MYYHYNRLFNCQLALGHFQETNQQNLGLFLGDSSAEGNGVLKWQHKDMFLCLFRLCTNNDGTSCGT